MLYEIRCGKREKGTFRTESGLKGDLRRGDPPCLSGQCPSSKRRYYGQGSHTPRRCRVRDSRHGRRDGVCRKTVPVSRGLRHTEIPAGKLDSFDEDRLEAAKRELREETGITADSWLDLGIFYSAAAYSDEKITMYLARGLHRGEQHLDKGEFLNVVQVPLAELVRQVMNGEITDGKTQLAVLKAAKAIELGL